VLQYTLQKREDKQRGDLCIFLDCRQVRSPARVGEGISEEVSERGVGVHDQKFNRSCDPQRASISLSPLSVNALTGRSLSCPSALPHPHASPEAAARAMSKRAMPPLDGHKSGKRRNPGQSVNQMPTQITARDVPMYFKKQPPLDPEVFVYVEVVIVWPETKKVSLTDVRMSEAKFNPARFPAFFTGDCTGFLRRVEVGDKLCLYLSDAKIHGVEEQCEQNTLNLPFTLTYDKTCRLKHVEKGMVGHSVTFPTRT